MERSEECSGPRQVAFGLCDNSLKHERVHVVRCDIENLIKFSQCFGKAPKSDIGLGVLAEQVGVARVEPLGFVKVGFAPVPLASSPRRHKPGIQESGCYWAEAVVLAQSNAPPCRNLLDRRSDNSPWPILPRRD